MTPASFASRHDEFHQRAIESAPAMGDDFGADGGPGAGAIIK